VLVLLLTCCCCFHLRLLTVLPTVLQWSDSGSDVSSLDSDEAADFA
jgi:hypothetical protein